MFFLSCRRTNHVVCRGGSRVLYLHIDARLKPHCLPAPPAAGGRAYCRARRERDLWSTIYRRRRHPLRSPPMLSQSTAQGSLWAGGLYVFSSAVVQAFILERSRDGLQGYSTAINRFGRVVFTLSSPCVWCVRT